MSVLKISYCIQEASSCLQNVPYECPIISWARSHALGCCVPQTARLCISMAASLFSFFQHIDSHSYSLMKRHENSKSIHTFMADPLWWMVLIYRLLKDSDFCPFSVTSQEKSWCTELGVKNLSEFPSPSPPLCCLHLVLAAVRNVLWSQDSPPLSLPGERIFPW